jgi:hypothetical protein
MKTAKKNKIIKKIEKIAAFRINLKKFKEQTKSKKKT